MTTFDIWTSYLVSHCVMCHVSDTYFSLPVIVIVSGVLELGHTYFCVLAKHRYTRVLVNMRVSE